MRIQIANRARKQLARLDSAAQARIRAKIMAYAADPTTQANNVKALKGGGGYRLRVGDYRVLFEVDDASANTMFIYRIAHRKDAYDD